MDCDTCKKPVTWTRAGKLIEANTDGKTYTMVHENDAGDEEILVGFTRNKTDIVDGMLHDGPMLWFKCVECYLRSDPKVVLEAAQKRSRKARSAMLEAERDERTIVDAVVALGLARKMKILIVHSAPVKSGDTLCGLSAHATAYKTCHTPDKDVLEKYMRWCGECVKKFEEEH